jgi:rhodanese-related sulfurtransferase
MLRRNAAWIMAALFAIGVIVAVATPARAVRKDIGNAELRQLQGAGALLVDVRTPVEYAIAHLGGAVNVPLDQLSQISRAWDKNRAVVVYCATGARSAIAATTLSALGFRKVYNLSEGIVAWDGPVVQGAKAGSSGPTTVKTNGKPLFIDFASST